MRAREPLDVEDDVGAEPIKMHLKHIQEELDLLYTQHVESSGRDDEDAYLAELQMILRKSIKFQKRHQKWHEKFHKLHSPQTIPDEANKVLQSAQVSYAFLNTFIANLTNACKDKRELWRVRAIMEQNEKNNFICSLPRTNLVTWDTWSRSNIDASILSAHSADQHLRHAPAHVLNTVQKHDTVKDPLASILG